MSTNKKTLIDGDFQVGSSHFYVDTENNYVGFNKINPTSSLDVNGNAFIATDMTVASNVTVGSNVIAQKFTGSAEGLTTIPADQISGVIPVANGGTGTTTSTGTGNLVKSDNPTFTGTVTADTFSGSGVSLTNIPMSQATGVLAVANGGTGVTTTTGTGSVVYSDSPTLTGTVSAGGANFSSNISASNVYAGYDTDTTSFLGRAAVGFSGITDEATFAHIDVNSTNNYALKQTALGETHVNSATSKSVKFLINDTEQARINTTGLGIGTDDPQFALDVHGNANVDVLRCNFISGDGWQLSNVAGYSWPTHANGNDIYYTTGNVGIGTEEPSAILEVAGADSATILRSAADAATTSYTELIRGHRPGTTSGGATLFINGSTATTEGGASTFTVRNDSGNLRLGHSSYETQVPSNFEVGEANLYVNTTNSRVGVGTIAPDAKLHVQGNTYVSSNLEVGQANLYVDTTNSRVGVGTTAPDANLHVVGNTYVSSNLEVGQDKFFVDTTTTRVGVGTSGPGYTLDVQGDLNFTGDIYKGGTLFDSGPWTKLENDITYTAGNVGIGTTSAPTAPLEVNGTVKATSFEGTASNVYITSSCTYTYYRLTFASGDGVESESLLSSASLAFNSGTNTLQTSRLNAFSGAEIGGDMDVNGSLGVTANVFLGSNSSIRQSTTTWTGDPGNGLGKIEYHSNRWYIVGGADSSYIAQFRRNNADKYWIYNDGNTGHISGDGIGLKFWNSDDYKIYMSSASNGSWGGKYGNSDYNMYFRMKGGTNRGFVYLNNRTVKAHLNGNGDFYINGGWFRTYGSRGWYSQTYGGGWFMQDTTYVRVYNNKRIYTGGDILAGGNVTAYSDKRHKKDIVKIDDPLGKIEKINGYTYTSKRDEKRYSGVIAQEVLEVLPEVVDKQESGYSVAYGNMAGLFVEAIKELKARIVELEKKIN